MDSEANRETFTYERFKSKIENPDYQKFKKTNGIWNQECYNHQHMVGSVAGLIKKYNCKSPEEFAEKYFQSGMERKKIFEEKFAAQAPLYLSGIATHDKIVNCRRVNAVVESNNAIIKLNYGYGRHRDYLKDVVKCFHNDISKIGNYSMEDATAYTFRRLFFETFKGDYKERQIIAMLNRKYPTINWEQAPSEIDSGYAIDILGTVNGKIVSGIQVKPDTYFLQEDQVELNKKKNKAFEKQYGVGAYYIAYSSRSNDPKDYLISSRMEADMMKVIQKLPA